MLGPELETFKGNKVVMGMMIFLALGVYALGDFIATRPFSDITTGGRIFLLSFVIWPVLLFFWVKSVRVTFHTDGISYRSLFGEKEIRWDALERFEYGAVKQRINFVPVGTYYHIKLVDADRKKLRLGNRVEHPDKVASKIIELSYPELFRKVVERFNADQELDFGAIRVSRSGGVKIKKFFGGYKEIPWAQVSSCDIRQGMFYVWSVGEKRTRGPGIRQVPNSFVLLGLLNAVLKSNK